MSTKEGALAYLRDGEQAAIDFVPRIRERVLGSEDAREGILSFVERRVAVFVGQ